jgi:serine/threonine protein kinase
MGILYASMHIICKDFKVFICVSIYKFSCSNSYILKSRDLKIDNMLLHGEVKSGLVKIADFGLSALIKPVCYMFIYIQIHVYTYAYKHVYIIIKSVK